MMQNTSFNNGTTFPGITNVFAIIRGKEGNVGEYRAVVRILFTPDSDNFPEILNYEENVQ